MPQNNPSIVDFSAILAAFYDEVDMNFKKIILSNSCSENVGTNKPIETSILTYNIN